MRKYPSDDVVREAQAEIRKFTDDFVRQYRDDKLDAEALHLYRAATGDTLTTFKEGGYLRDHYRKIALAARERYAFRPRYIMGAGVPSPKLTTDGLALALYNAERSLRGDYPLSMLPSDVTKEYLAEAARIMSLRPEADMSRPRFSAAKSEKWPAIYVVLDRDRPDKVAPFYHEENAVEAAQRLNDDPESLPGLSWQLTSAHFS